MFLFDRGLLNKFLFEIIQKFFFSEGKTHLILHHRALSNTLDTCFCKVGKQAYFCFRSHVSMLFNHTFKLAELVLLVQIYLLAMFQSL